MVYNNLLFYPIYFPFPLPPIIFHIHIKMFLPIYPPILTISPNEKQKILEIKQILFWRLIIYLLQTQKEKDVEL